jgi:hypothetical protein
VASPRRNTSEDRGAATIKGGAMFLGAYEFEGDTDELIAGYESLAAAMPPASVLVHVCVRRDGGITVFDACPTSAVFAAFSTSPEFLGAVRAAGLPQPSVRPVGDVHRAVVRDDGS